MSHSANIPIFWHFLRLFYRVPHVVGYIEIYDCDRIIIHKLKHGKVTKMTLQVTQGHTVTATVQFVDTNGNPMLAPVTPDSPPTWTSVETPQSPAPCVLAPSADGLSCVITTPNTGNAVVSLSAIVGGVTYDASITIDVGAPPQVLGGVAILTTVN